MLAVVSAFAYGISVAIGALAAVALCGGARLRPGGWTTVAARALAVVLGADAVVLAALFLVVGLGITPRAHAVPRVFAITATYTAFVGAVDALSGANYMFLRHPPANWTLLRLLGPWPWYIASATGVAVILLVALDAPFRAGRRNRLPTKQTTVRQLQYPAFLPDQ